MPSFAHLPLATPTVSPIGSPASSPVPATSGASSSGESLQALDSTTSLTITPSPPAPIPAIIIGAEGFAQVPLDGNISEISSTEGISPPPPAYALLLLPNTGAALGTEEHDASSTQDLRGFRLPPPAYYENDADRVAGALPKWFRRDTGKWAVVFSVCIAVAILAAGVIAATVMMQVQDRTAPTVYGETNAAGGVSPNADPAVLRLINTTGMGTATTSGECTVSALKLSMAGPSHMPYLWNTFLANDKQLKCSQVTPLIPGEKVTIASNFTFYSECDGTPRVYYNIMLRVFRGRYMEGDFAGEFLDCANTTGPVPTLNSVAN